MIRSTMPRALALIILFIAALAPAAAQTQVGTVVSVSGTALVERAGKPARILGVGEALEQKDVINVAQGSHAVLEFTDKTRVTLRPNTVFRVESYSAAQGPAQGMVLGLSKGGFRAVTGEIGKQNPQSVRFQTDNVVLGIRGTEFDARLCEDDCAGEDRPKPAVRAIARGAGRLIEVNGSVTTGDKDTPRDLVAGAVLYEGETLATGPGANALVLFRDGSRVTLPANSRLLVARFDFDEASPGKGQAHLKLLAGSAHVYTGQLAKIGRDAFLFETGAGVIHTPGAGFSVGARKGAGAPSAQRALHYADAGTGHTRSDAYDVAAASLPDDVLVVHTWDGTIIIQTATERIEVPTASTLAIAIVDGKITFLPAPPSDLTGNLSRPNLVSIDPSTFGQQGPPPERGLYVWVRDGAVTLGSGGQVVELKAGSAARITDKIAMLGAIPNFMRFDFTPRPGGTIPPQIPRFFRAPDGSVTGMCK